MKATAVKQQQDQVRDIPLDQLVRSRFEPRKTVGQAALAELAESIRANGVIEPLIVRLLPGPDDTLERANAEPVFEIGAGQRRWEASRLAGKTTAPCIVRELTDEQFRELAITSNLQREDLPPLEEAKGFLDLLCFPGRSVESVAATLGKSASYISRRLKLLDAIKPVREALAAGAIEVGHALELSRLSETQQKELLQGLNVGYEYSDDEDLAEPVETSDDDDEDEGADDAAVDPELLESDECRYCGCDPDNACELPNGMPCSWANAERNVCTHPDCLKRWRRVKGEPVSDAIEWFKTTTSLQALKATIAQRALKNLNEAPFPLDREDLGAQACTICPKRTLNSALLFNDLAGSDTCTDRACFNRKLETFVSIELSAAAAEKTTLLKLSQSHTTDKSELSYHTFQVFKTENECPHGEEGIWINGSNRGNRATICREQKCKTHRGGSQSSSSSYSSSRAQQSPAEKEKAKEERRGILDKLKAEKAYRSALFHAIVAAPVSALLAETIALEVAIHTLTHTGGMHEGKFAELLGWDVKLLQHYNGTKGLRERLGGMSTEQCIKLALLSTKADELSVQEYSLGSKPKGLERIAELLGVDPAEVRKGGKPPVPAAPGKPQAKKVEAAKKATPKPAKPKKAVLSATTRKRIAEAQKKRWKTAVTKPATRKAANAPAKKAAKKGGRK